jgi:hypothetical protein
MRPNPNPHGSVAPEAAVELRKGHRSVSQQGQTAQQGGLLPLLWSVSSCTRGC